jgi:predicted 3-demethylubiquinone-9 3-methyltransferase (glyoxalase superfamily)
MPYVITVPQELKEPAVNLWRQIDSNEPAVLAYKDTFDNITVNAMQTTNTSVPQMIEALQSNKQDIMNECLEFLGISPNNPSKVQQQSVAEADQQHENIRFARWSFVEARRQAVKQINDKFGLNVQIVVAHDIATDNFNMQTDEMIATTVNKGADVGNANKHDGGRKNG